MSKLIPKEESPVVELSEADNDYLRADSIVQAINAALPKGALPLAPIPKDYVFRKRDRATVQDALHAAFELNGGVPGLMRFAATHPKEFYGLWSKLLPPEEIKQGGTTVIVQSAIPTNPLDFVTVNETGQVVHITPDQDDLPE